MIVALRSPQFYKILTINKLCVILILYKSFQKISKRLVVFKSLYYDLDAGRIIIDDISYLDLEMSNELNLYAYCGNNPVMRIDENCEKVVWYKFRVEPSDP